jgi:peptide/nickel transport system substrate-binding protein
MFPRLPVPGAELFWGRFRMPDRGGESLPFADTTALHYARPSLARTLVAILCLVPALVCLVSCWSRPDPNTLVMIIESSPTNLDPRVGIDGVSERIDNLMFDDLLDRDEHLNVVPALAERWEIPDPRTYVFHLHPGVKFHNGAALTARDVKWTFDSLLQGKIRSTKSAAFRLVDQVEARDDLTVVFHLKEPFATLLWNLSDGAIGIVPNGTLDEMSQHPIGSGPFRFVSAEPDKEVVIERNPEYWRGTARIERVRFAVVPDINTRALELRKGSADIVMNALTPDMVVTLEREPALEVLRGPGTILQYMAFNFRDPLLKDVRVRQALAYAIDRGPILEYLWRGFAQPADSILPPESWAYTNAVRTYHHDPQRARDILDEAGYRPVNGVRFHLTMKTSTDENTRLMVAVLQQQLREVGIRLDIRTFEFATFFSDVTKGAFQLYSLRWIGGNEDPDIFEYAFHTSKFTPNGANRSFYSNPRVDALIDQARMELDQGKRKVLYGEIQKILAEDVPSINLWYLDNVMIHSKRVKNLTLNPPGNFDFLRTADLSAN